jgi:hypothetical protein
VGTTGLSYETRIVFFNYVRPSGFFFFLVQKGYFDGRRGKPGFLPTTVF